MGCELLLYRGSALIGLGIVILVGVIIGKVKNRIKSKGDSGVNIDEGSK